MAEIRSIKPSEEIRLRKWPPGRVSQLKIMVANLEQSVNRSLAGQVAQSGKRRFSPFVPVIPFQDISGEVEFRELRVQFEPPKGLKNLLFYEFQISRTSGFFQFQSYEGPDPSWVFGGLEDNTQYFIRIRVVTSDNLVGPFSENLTATTPTAKAFGTLDTSETTTTISSTDFVDLFVKNVTFIGGKVYYSLQFSTQLSASPDANRFNYGTIELRWTEDGSQVGQNLLITNHGYGGASGGGNLLSIFDGNSEIASAANPLTTTTAFLSKRRGTLIQKFHSTVSGSHQLILQGKKVNYHTLPNEFGFNAGASIDSFIADSIISVKNFTSFEIFTQG